MGECMLVRRGGGKAALKGISVKTPPAKLEYLAGDTFDQTGMVLTADVGGVPVDVTTGYTVTPDPLTVDTTTVTISYTAGGKTVSTTQAETMGATNRRQYFTVRPSTPSMQPPAMMAPIIRP